MNTVSGGTMDLAGTTVDPVLQHRGDEVRLEVAASADAVAALVTDIASMGRWSPECHRCEWLDGATGPVVGARFKGWNKRGFARWSTTCTVLAYEPGRRFDFDTGFTRWSYRFEPMGPDRCEVVEAYQAHTRHWLSERTAFLQRTPDPQAAMRTAMEATLQRIAAAATGS